MDGSLVAALGGRGGTADGDAENIQHPMSTLEHRHHGIDLITQFQAGFEYRLLRCKRQVQTRIGRYAHLLVAAVLARRYAHLVTAR